MPHNAVKAEVALLLRNDQKDLRSFLFNKLLFFIDIKVEKGINQPPRPGNESCKYQIINRPGHPSLKRRGEYHELSEFHYSNRYWGYPVFEPPFRGVGGQN